MIVRRIRPEEVKRTEELMSISFDGSYRCELSPEALFQKYQSDPQNREQEHCLERFAAFCEDDKTMMGCFVLQPFSIHFDGHTESMYGVGGVSTLPHFRKSGSIRGCFEKALPYLYEKGAAFSYLYPFSTAFYRKFGYERCCQKQLYTVALRHIPSFSLSGSCYLLDASAKAMAAADIPAVNQLWQKRYNMMVQDAPYDLSYIAQVNPYKDQVFTYVYRSAAGVPLAYMTFRNLTAPSERSMECSRFFYVNEEGLQGLLALAKSFASDYKQIRFLLPEGPALEHVLPEWAMGAVSCQLVSGGMVRIINVKKVLQDAAYRGSGKISLCVQDNFIPENNQTFSIAFTDGRCTGLTAFPATEAADVALPVSALSALLAGGYDTDAVSVFSEVKTAADQTLLSQIFYKKPTYIATAF